MIFLPGFRSDMTGAKALALEALCREEGRAFVRFDYTGHGRSEGRFVDGTLGQWLDDALTALDSLSHGPQILVGSSMGGWIMLLAALARPQRVAGLVGIAAAPDFASRLIDRELAPEMRAALRRDGIVHLPSQYSAEPTPISLKFIEEARRHELLGAAVPIACPVRLIHGMADPDVEWNLSIEIARRLTTSDVEIHLVKAGDHRLSEPRDLARLCSIVSQLCRSVELA